MVDAIDFENFKIEETRALEIRHFVEGLKSAPWILDLKSIVTEFGEKGPDVQVDPGTLFQQSETKFYRPGTEHPAHGIEISLDGPDLKMNCQGRRLLELSFLPKGNEFAVFFVNESSYEEITTLVALLEEDFLRAKRKKNERQAAFKAKLEG